MHSPTCHANKCPMRKIYTLRQLPRYSVLFEGGESEIQYQYILQIIISTHISHVHIICTQSHNKFIPWKSNRHMPYSKAIFVIYE